MLQKNRPNPTVQMQPEIEFFRGRVAEPHSCSTDSKKTIILTWPYGMTPISSQGTASPSRGADAIEADFGADAEIVRRDVVSLPSPDFLLSQRIGPAIRRGT